ncbi:MAG: hypothetical protein HRF42_05460 [Candidatus Brocadia sp.]
MMMNTFFVCTNCGNDKEFKIFTSNFRIVKQSPELGIRTDESDILPNLRQKDNYIECQLCLQRFEYENAATIGKKYIQASLRLLKMKHELPKQGDHILGEKQPLT